MSLRLDLQIPSQPGPARGELVPAGSRRKRSRKKLKPAEERQPPRPCTHPLAEPKQEGRPRGREWREPWLPKGVRRCDLSPTLFQLRVRVGPLKNDGVNFGLYGSPAEANRVGRLVRKGLARGEYIWDTLVRLQAACEVPRRVLPRWVYRRADGLFGARIKHGPRRGEELRTPVRSAILAHDLFRLQLGLPPLAGFDPARHAERLAAAVTSTATSSSS